MKINQSLVRVRKLLALIIVTGVSVSCSMFAKHGIPLSPSKILDSIQTYIDTTHTKTVVLVPMYHIAEASDYDKLSEYLDTLKSKGYVIFWEGLFPTNKYSDTSSIPLYKDLCTLYSPDDSLELNILKRKVRKVLGFELGADYDKMASKRGMVFQNKSSLKFKGDKDYWADLTYADAVLEFEELYGEIVLSQYDFDCPLESGEYKGKEDKRFSDLRTGSNKCNERLGRWVLDPHFDRIVVVFGYAHISYLRWFVLKNNGYTLISNPNLK